MSIFIPNWRRTLARSHSLWIGAYLPFGLLLASEAVFAVTGLDTSPYARAGLLLLCLALAVFARIVDQGIASGQGPRRHLRRGLRWLWARVTG